MTARLPLVLGPNGLPQQLQAGDTLPLATNSAFGVAKGDGSTINIVAGVASAVGGGVIPGTQIYMNVATVNAANTGGAQFICTVGYSTPGDGGGAAYYLAIDQNPQLPAFSNIRSGDGYYYEYTAGDGPVNILAFGVVRDGVTDNATAFDNFRYALRTVNPSYTTGTSVTTTGGSPGTINWVNHAKRVGDALIFLQGTPPTGLVLNKVYYVAFDGLARNSLRLVAGNPWYSLNTIGNMGPSLNWTGNGSGLVMYDVNAEWIDVVLPPGQYATSQDFNLVGGQRKTRLFAYGAAVESLLMTGRNVSFGYGGYGDGPGGLTTAYINSVTPGNYQIVLQNAGDAAAFSIGGWLCIYGIDTQDPFGVANSFPPNAPFCEFHQLQDISGVTISLGSPAGARTTTRNGYLSTWPQFISTVTSPSVVITTGQVIAAPMGAMWDLELELYGFKDLRNDVTQGQLLMGCRKWLIKDVDLDYELVPTQTQTGIINNVNAHSGIVVDKLIEYLEIDNCNTQNLLDEGSSPTLLVVNNMKTEQLDAGGRNVVIRNSDIGSLQVGPRGFGRCEVLTVQGGNISLLSQNEKPCDSYGGVQNCLVNWTFSGGVFSQPIELTQANPWAIPGASFYINDILNTNDNMGSPGQVENIFLTATNTYTNRTISAGGADAVVDYGAAAPANGTTVSFVVAVPTGLVMSVPYYVVNSGGPGANKSNIAATPGGVNLQATGAGTTTTTIYVSPMFNMTTTLFAVPAGTSASHTATISSSGGALFDWGTTAPTLNTPVILKGSTNLSLLGTGFNNITAYYAVSPSGNTFKLSLTPSGSAIAFSGSGAATITATSNPLKFHQQICPRVNMVGVSGHPWVMDACTGPQNRPLWSYGSRRYIGRIDTNPIFLAYPIHVFGALDTTIDPDAGITVRVDRADTSGGSATLVLSAKGFNTSAVASNLSGTNVTIDLTQTGTRKITATTASTPIGGDTLAAYAGYISGDITATFAGSTASNIGQCAKVTVIAQTTQGLDTETGVRMFGEINFHTWSMTDSIAPGIGASL